MKELKKQLRGIWMELKPLQKMAIIFVGLALASSLFYLIFHSTSPSYVSLYPSNRLSLEDIEQIRSYLDREQIDYQERQEGQLYVLDKESSKVRAALSHLGIPKQFSGKGFELFDSNTWIKGDKELQVLEMRALKGQLEKDLAEFDNIKSASVILDLPPPRHFGGEEIPTKASVILTLMPHKHLSVSELSAVTYHLAGAVRGLKPNMIAISDTKGRLYQTLDSDSDLTHNIGMEFLFEEHLKDKIHHLVYCLLGKKTFFVSVTAKLNESQRELSALDVFLLIDPKNYENEAVFEALKIELVKQITLLLQSQNVPLSISIEGAPFKTHDEWPIQQGSSSSLLLLCFFGLLCGLGAVGFAFFFFKKRRKKNITPSCRETSLSPERGSLEHILLGLESKTLHSLLSEEDPKSLALFFADLEKAKAEQLIASLPFDLQQEVLKNLIEHNYYQMPS